MAASLLLLGYSNIAMRRVIPAVRAVAAGNAIDIASKSRRVASVHAGHGVFFGDYDSALEMSSAETVYVSLPNALHYEVAKKALRSGRHVVVDKPACVTLRETEELLDCASRRNRLLAEATVFNYHHQFGRIRTFLEKYGPLECVDAHFAIPPPPIDNFRNHKTWGGGCLLDMGPYAAALARIFLNDEGLRVHALTGGRHPQTGIDIGFAVLAGVPRGPRLTCQFSFHGEYQNRLTLIAARGSLVTERVFSLPADVEPSWLLQANSSVTKIIVAKDDAFATFLRAVFQAIAEGEHSRFAHDMLWDARFRERLSESIAA